MSESEQTIGNAVASMSIVSCRGRCRVQDAILPTTTIPSNDNGMPRAAPLDRIQTRLVQCSVTPAVRTQFAPASKPFITEFGNDQGFVPDLGHTWRFR